MIHSFLYFVAIGQQLHGAPRSQPADTLPGCLWPGPSQLLMERPSPPDSVYLAIGADTAKICYSRPRARGRQIFGQLVEYGKRWRTGANEPTTLYVPVRVRVAGVSLDPGLYVLLTVPGPERWEILLNRVPPGPPAEMFNNVVEAGRGEVTVEALSDLVEQFTIKAVSAPGSPALVLEWERTRVQIGVVPDR